MRQELNYLVEQAHLLFGGYRVGPTLEVCTYCCITEEEERQLACTEVREISHQLLYRWNHAAKPHLPDIVEFKHFLPRFLNFVSQFQWPSHSTELAFKSFKYYDRSAWTDEEFQLIDQFCRAFFTHCLQIWPIPDGSCLDDILVMMSPTQVDVRWLLDHWSSAKNVEAALHFAKFVTSAFSLKKGIKFQNAFADEKLGLTVEEWVRNERVLAHFTERFEHFILSDPRSSDTARSELSYAYEWLNAYR